MGDWSVEQIAKSWIIITSTSIGMFTNKLNEHRNDVGIKKLIQPIYTEVTSNE